MLNKNLDVMDIFKCVQTLSYVFDVSSLETKTKDKKVCLHESTIHAMKC